MQSLTAVVSKVHGIAGSAPDKSVELDLARRMGVLQGAALYPDVRSPRHQAVPNSVQVAAFAAPVTDVAEFEERLDQLDDEQRRVDDTNEKTAQAAELAATAIAGLIQIPDLGDNEIVQIVKEYLGGLVEGSPLKDIFAAITHRVTGNTRPPDAAKLVVPDLSRLKSAALELWRLARIKIDVTGQRDTAAENALKESPVDAATDLMNEVRYFARQTGPCTGCPHPASPEERAREGVSGERPAEQEVRVPIR